MMAWENAFSQQIIDLALSEKDVEELRSERTIKHTQITAEEIEALLIDENLSPIERIIHVFSNGKDIQKVHTINHMYDFVKNESKENIEKVLSIFENDLDNTSKEVQIAAANFLSKICEKRFLNGERFASRYWCYLLDSLKNKDSEICDAWLNALVSSLALIPKRYVNEVVEFLKSSGSLTQGTHSRLLCCKLVSHVCKYVDKKKLTPEMMPIMRSLCQDIDLDVRACMCGELDVMVSYLESDVIKEYILPELCLLLHDEETNVRLVGVETVSKILPIIDSALMQSLPLAKIIIKFYSKAIENKELDVLIGCARYFGKILCLVSGCLDEEQKSSLIQSYKYLCGQGCGDMQDSNVLGGSKTFVDKSAECRYWCAYNFPAVLTLCTTEEMNRILLPLFLSLIKDPHPAVRKPLACAFHEISKLLAKDMDFVNSSLITFLNEKDVEVLDGVMSGLPVTLGLMFTNSSQQHYVTNLLPTLIDCEKYISKSLRWRTHEKFIRNMSCLHKFLPPDDVYLKLVPILFSIFNDNKVLPVKLATGYTLLTFIKYNRNADERDEMCLKFETELARSKSKTSRILFLDLCHYVSDLFSRSFFKEKYYDVAMELAADPVVNVRLKFCETLPLLKSQIRLPADRLLLQSLEQTVRRIMAMDNDRDVANAIRHAITEMDSVRLSMDGTPLTEEDMIDREKEAEEEILLDEYMNRRLEDKLATRDKTRSQLFIEKNNQSRRSLTSELNIKELPAKASQQKGSKSVPKLNVSKKSTAKPPKETPSLSKALGKVSSGPKLSAKKDPKCSSTLPPTRKSLK